MKKSKIIVPALGLLLLSTAASVSGSVAWFTANRVYGFTAGQFAVVNTKDNLNCTLGNGFGTTTSNNEVSVTSGYKLTDASFDHTDTDLPIIIPNTEGDKVASKVNLANIGSQTPRATNTYSAFSWTGTFEVTFGATADNDVGLFFDVADPQTYVNTMYKVGSKLPSGSALAAGADVTSYWLDPACQGDHATGSAVDDGTKYYKPVSDDTTAKGYRIAIIPTNIPTNSLGLTKVWAENQTSAKSNFVDGLDVDDALAGTAYSKTTTQNDGAGTTITERDVTGDAVAVISSDVADQALTVPSSTTAKSAALGMKNYLGFFKASANATVALTFTFVAWYEGTDENISNSAKAYDTVAVGMQFGICNLS